MTFIEQACHRQAVALWRLRPNFKDLHTLVLVRAFQFADASGAGPTASASVLLMRSVAALGAEAYRSKAPVLSEWKSSLDSEPDLLSKAFSTFCSGAREELHLHQEIVTRLVGWSPQRTR